MPDLAGTASQISVQLVRQKTPHLPFAVALLHHSQGRVLRQRLRHHVRARDMGPDELMAPPLMGQLMRGHKVREINVLGRIACPSNETKLRKRYGVGERLRKAAIARELQDAKLPELEGAVVRLVVVQPSLAGGDHIVDVIWVRRRRVHLKVDALVGLTLHVIPARHIAEEIQNRLIAHTVFVVVAPIRMPRSQRIPWRKCDLGVRRADRRVKANPVRIAGKQVHAAPIRIRTRSHIVQCRQFLFSPTARVIKLDVFVVADIGEIIGVEEHAAISKLRPFVAIAKAMGSIPNLEAHVELLARLQRPLQLVDRV